MAAFVMVYDGGSTPKADDDIAHEMARWGDWMNSLGSQPIEPGAPVGKSKTLSASGVSDNRGANPFSGYLIVDTESIEAALELIKACPHLDSCTIELTPLIEMPVQ